MQNWENTRSNGGGGHGDGYGGDDEDSVEKEEK